MPANMLEPRPYGTRARRPQGDGYKFIFVLFVSFVVKHHLITGPNGRMTLPNTSLSTCARPAYMAENPQKIPS